MHIVIPHKFTKTEALSRVKNALDAARTQAADKVDIKKEEWQEDTLHFEIAAEGKTVSGTFAVENNQYVLDAKLPLVMRLFEKKIEKELGEQIKAAMQRG